MKTVALMVATVVVIATVMAVGLVKVHAGLQRSGAFTTKHGPVDYSCVNDCVSAGYMYGLCVQKCTY